MFFFFSCLSFFKNETGVKNGVKCIFNTYKLMNFDLVSVIFFTPLRSKIIVLTNYVSKIMSSDHLK